MFIKKFLIALSMSLFLSTPVLAEYAPNATFTWINAADPQYGGLPGPGDVRQSTGCTTSGTTLTCNGQSFSPRDCHTGGACTGPVDKIGWISYVGPGYHAFTFTITNYLSVHSVTMSGSPTTNLPFTAVVKFGQTTALGTGYLLGDKVKPNCAVSPNCTTVSSASPDAVAIVNVIQPVTQPLIVNAGSGGTPGDTCTLTGTTGHPSSGNYLQITVTLNGSGNLGTVGSQLSGSYANASKANYLLYPDGSGNLSNVSNEPVTASCNTGVLTGAALNFTGDFGAVNLKATEFTGFYTNITCDGSTLYSFTAITGSGSGVTDSCNSIPPTATWGTSVYTTMTNVINARNALVASTPTRPVKISVPGGFYVSPPFNDPIVGSGCIQGDDHFETMFFMEPNITGDMISFNGNGQGAQQGFGGTFTAASDTKPVIQAGCLASHLAVVGDRSSSQPQAAQTLYGGTAWGNEVDFYALNVRGPCIRTGASASSGSGTTHEGWFTDIRCNEDGASTGLGDSFPLPSVQFETIGSGEPPNGLHLSNFRIYHSHGPSMVLADCTPGNNNPHVNTLDFSHFELSGDDGADGQGDNLQLGDPDCLRKHFAVSDGTTILGGGVNGASSLIGSGNTINHSRAGYANVHVMATPSSGDSANISFTGSLGGGGASYGGGVWVGSGTNDKFTNTASDSNDYPIQVVTETYWNGSSSVPGQIGPGIAFDDSGDGSSITTAKNIEAAEQPGGANPVQYASYSAIPGHLTPLWIGTQAVTNAGSGATSMFGTGIGATRFGSNNLNVGTTFDFQSGGVYSAAIAPGSLTFTLGFAGTTIASAMLTPGQATNATWNERTRCTVYTIGTSGTLFCVGSITMGTATVGFSTGASAATIDTTSAGVINNKTQWNALTGVDSITSQVTTITFIGN